MDRYEAQYNFWSSFGVPAYEQNSVPDLDIVTFPYITFAAVATPFAGEVDINASVWTRSTSWQTADALADLIDTRLKYGGEIVGYDGGIIWITAGTPLAQNMGDPDDDAIKRKLLNVELHFY